MKTIGLTGSIAMGKSTAARLFGRLGVPVYDADAAIHALLAKGGAGVSPVAKAFAGVEINGAIDRAKLGRTVFADPAALARLEAILHPLAARARDAFLARHRRSRTKRVVLDVPLLFETGAQALFNHIVTVACSEKTQIHRISARGLADSDALAIIRSQLALARKVELAHFVVWNDGSLENLRQQALEFAARIRPGNQPADHA